MIRHGWLIMEHTHNVVHFGKIRGALVIHLVGKAMTLSIHRAVVLIDTRSYLYKTKYDGFCIQCGFTGLALGTVMCFKGTVALSFLGCVTLVLKALVGMKLLCLSTRHTTRTTNLTLSIWTFDMAQASRNCLAT